MLVKLALNSEKLKEYNRRIREIKAEYPTFSFEEVEKLEDIFCPYVNVVKDNILVEFKAIAKDHRPLMELKNVYVCGWSADDYTLEMTTDYKKKINLDSPIYWWNYGVADNASQVIDYYEYLLSMHGDYMNNRKFVILLTPIFRESQPERGGWRWHKWGQYIGDFEPQCEYLYDEQGIDYVYTFTILEVEECQEEDK